MPGLTHISLGKLGVKMSKDEIFDEIYVNHWYEWMFDEKIMLNQEIEHLTSQINKHLNTIDELAVKYRALENENVMLTLRLYGGLHA